VYYLQQQGVSRLDVVNFLSHGITKANPEPAAPEPPKAAAAAEADTRSDAQKSPLDLYATDLNTEASLGRIDPLIGREKRKWSVSSRCYAAAARTTPCWSGRLAWVKTAIAEGLALRIQRGDVPDILSEARVYALDMGALLAGTKYRGDFEQRLKAVLKQLKETAQSICLSTKSIP